MPRQGRARSAGVGVACPRCGCQDLRVSYTRHMPGRVIRARVCRHCGRRVVTHESVVG